MAQAKQIAQNGVLDNAAAVPSIGVIILPVDAQKANDAVRFYKAAFGAEEVPRNWNPYPSFEDDEPLIIAAELKLPGVSFLVAYRADADALTSPVKLGQCGVVFSMETDDFDGLVAKAVGAGAVAEDEVVEEVVENSDGPCGPRLVVNVMDPYGFVWLICSPVVVDNGPFVSKL